MTSTVLAQDIAGNNGTAYTGAFSATKDMGLYLHDSTDGVTTGVSILYVSQSGSQSTGVHSLFLRVQCRSLGLGLSLSSTFLAHKRVCNLHDSCGVELAPVCCNCSFN